MYREKPTHVDPTSVYLTARINIFRPVAVGGKKVDNTHPCRKTESRLGHKPWPRKLSAKGRLSLLRSYIPVAKLTDVCSAIKLSVLSASGTFSRLALDTPESLLPQEKDQFVPGWILWIRKGRSKIGDISNTKKYAEAVGEFPKCSAIAERKRIYRRFRKPNRSLELISV